MPASPAAPSFTRRALIGLIVIGIVTAMGAGAAAQDPSTTTPDGVLVPGDTPATTVTPTTTPPATTLPAGGGGGGGLLDFDANAKVWIIVGALVAVAILVLVLTVVYWRHTKPDRVAQNDESDEPPEKKPAKPKRRRRERDPFADDSSPGDEDGDPSSGPVDLDQLLGPPDSARSVFGAADEPEESSR